MSLFCRHNRFISECPICSKGTVLDPNRKAERRPRPNARPGSRSRPKGRVQAAGATRVSRGPFASAGPYEDGREVRLEKVPGGLRLAAWHAGQLVKDAPVVALADLPEMLGSAAEQGLLPKRRGRLARRARGRRARREPRAHRRAARRAARGAPRRRPAADRALDHAPEPGLGAAGDAGAAAGGPLPRRARGGRCQRASWQAIRWTSDYLRVPLRLVTGPANAAKAGEVLGGLRARLDDEPILVVPTFGDVEHAQRELADRGAVFGARVMRFDWLFGRSPRAPASAAARRPTSSAS